MLQNFRVSLNLLNKGSFEQIWVIPHRIGN